MIFLWLVLTFIACATLSLLLCSVALLLFPKFRSGEYKPGSHRADFLPGSGREIKTIELPLVGGPALVLAIEAIGIGAGWIFKFSSYQWTLLIIGLGATFCFMVLGFIDDWHKVFSKEGLSQRAKFIGVFLVSAAVAIFYFFLLSSGRLPYSPYIDLPIIGPLLCPRGYNATLGYCQDYVTFGQVAYFLWLPILVLITGVIGSLTSLSVDFSDGLDGLSGGLVFCAALAFGIIITGNINSQHPEGIVLEVLSLLCAGGTLGYLPLNWPSSWAARRGTARRRAQIIMGDSGALALGGMLAMIAIFSRQEILLLMVGAAFVLEGLSALISAKMLTPFFRKRLEVLRFASTRTFIPHTEFPKPFLATPLHQHFDLLGWDRRRLVYGAWALGACFAVLGVMVGTAPQTWERYLGRILVLILAWLVWSSGSWTRKYFVGKHPAERTRRRRLALFYGYPYRVMGIPLFHLVEVIEASEDVIDTPAEELALWHRMNIFDARAMLGLYCYRAGYYPAALAQWTRIPQDNLALRPEIARLLEEVDERLALEKQATQPMRRDQILQQAAVGNVAPADLPNPHEPVPHEEKPDDNLDNWDGSPDTYTRQSDDLSLGLSPSPVSSTLAAEMGAAVPVNHNSGVHATVSPPSPVQKPWFARFLRYAPGRER
jgi:UDP-N-acetylmuramyl pentapeptide phosphotransferase/UDP-N-acetylglucosamine-1-phosphate transferase